MKSSLFGLFVFFGAAAMACPNLSGTYYCPDERVSRSSLSISQTLTDGITTYILEDFETTVLVADGAARPYEEVAGAFKKVGERAFFCENEVLAWSETYRITKNTTGELVASGEKVVSLKTAANGDLLTKGREVLDFQGQKKINIIDDACILQRLQNLQKL